MSFQLAAILTYFERGCVVVFYVALILSYVHVNSVQLGDITSNKPALVVAQVASRCPVLAEKTSFAHVPTQCCKDWPTLDQSKLRQVLRGIARDRARDTTLKTMNLFRLKSCRWPQTFQCNFVLGVACRTFSMCFGCVIFFS